MSLYKKLNTLLAQAGLKEAEILIYIELLKKPAQTKWEIVERTGLDRNSVYRAFEKLENYKMIEYSNEGLKGLSLKFLVNYLQNSNRKQGKLVRKLKDVAPFLHCPADTVEEIETYYRAEDIAEPYLFMAENCQDTNLDFGDFDSFIPTIGGIPIACEFRRKRAEKSKHHAIVTTTGDYSEYFCTRDSKERFKTQIDYINLPLKNNFIIFSDTGDYVMYNKVDEEGDISSVLVKSRIVADIQRAQFDMFSQKLENLN